MGATVDFLASIPSPALSRVRPEQLVRCKPKLVSLFKTLFNVAGDSANAFVLVGESEFDERARLLSIDQVRKGELVKDSYPPTLDAGVRIRQERRDPGHDAPICNDAEQLYCATTDLEITRRRE